MTTIEPNEARVTAGLTDVSRSVNGARLFRSRRPTIAWVARGRDRLRPVRSGVRYGRMLRSSRRLSSGVRSKRFASRAT